MIKGLLPFILFALIMQSCNMGSTQTWKDEHIDADTRAQINTLNNDFFKAVVSDDTLSIRTMASDVFIKSIGGYVGAIPGTFKRYLKTDTFNTLNQLKIHYAGVGDGVLTIPSDIEGKECYIYVKSIEKDMYVSILRPKANISEWLVNMIYAKYGSTWKIIGVQVGHYSIFGKTAPDYYTLAKASYDKGYLINAHEHMLLCKDCLRPGNGLIQYKTENEIKTFFEKVETETTSKYDFPLTVKNVKTAPKIFNIHPYTINDEGFFPLIAYLSTVDLHDSLAYRKENMEIRKEVGRIFNGINEENKYIFYHAYNEMPNSVNNPLYRGCIDTVIRN